MTPRKQGAERGHVNPPFYARSHYVKAMVPGGRSNGEEVAHCNVANPRHGVDGVALAAFFARACNAFDPLVDALEELRDAVKAETEASKAWHESPANTAAWDRAGKRREKAIEASTRALALARVEKP